MENIKDPILQIKDVCISYTSDVMAVKHVSADIEKIRLRLSWGLLDVERVRCCVP